MAVSSYGNSSETSGIVRILKDLDHEVSGKDIIIVEDIVDSGVTLNYLLIYLMSRRANSVEIVSLLTKPSRRKVDIDCKYIGFEVPDEFLVGYGLDYAEKYRNLPFVGVLKREVYEKNLFVINIKNKYKKKGGSLNEEVSKRHCMDNSFNTLFCCIISFKGRT